MYKKLLWAIYFVALTFYITNIFADPIDGGKEITKDPTQPPSYSADVSRSKITESVTSFILDAVLISETTKLAVINNNIFKVGDVIGEEKIKSIDTYSVTLVGEQGEVVLHLFGSPIKEPAK